MERAIRSPPTEPAQKDLIAGVMTVASQLAEVQPTGEVRLFRCVCLRSR